MNNDVHTSVRIAASNSVLNDMQADVKIRLECRLAHGLVRVPARLQVRNGRGNDGSHTATQRSKWVLRSCSQCPFHPYSQPHVIDPCEDFDNLPF